MAWNHFPSEIRLKIIKEVIHSNYINEKGKFDSILWHKTLENCRLVSKDWNCMVIDQLVRTVPLNVSMEDRQNIYPLRDDFLSIDTVFKEFDDDISLLVLKAGLPRLGVAATAAWRKARASAPDNDPIWEENYLKSYLVWRAAGFLSLAVQHGLAACVNYLLDSGANVNYHFPPIWRYSYGYPPLQDAMFGRRADMAMLLISRGADWKILDVNQMFVVSLGHSFLCWGMYYNKIELVKFMLVQGVPIYKESIYMRSYAEAQARGYSEVLALVDAAEGMQLWPY